MKINNKNTFNNNPTSFGAKAYCINSPKVLNFVENKLSKWSSPQQRVVLGATALTTQPIIDYNNHKVDKETRTVSTARTIAKIIAGTATGFAIRWGCIKGIEKWTNIAENASSAQKALLPSAKESLGAIRSDLRLLKNHRNALGTLLALGVMLFTNFLIDVPLTKALTNVFTKEIKKGQSQSKTEGGNK